MRNRSNTRGLALCGVLVGMFAAISCLQAQKVSEYDVEAAYLYNFGKFVRWPAPEPGTTFDICILGHDPFAGSLQKLIAGDRIDGREIHRRVIASAPEAAGCAIVYIADSEEANAKKTVAVLSGKGELLVSGLPHFLDEGGMIQFVLQDNRVRFAVNLDSASSSRLVFSSELLKVAVRVVGSLHDGGAR
jgi:hypothetical protein